MKQSAVEWLHRWFMDNPEATYEEDNKAFEQAKELERQQIESAYRSGSVPTNGFPEKPSAEEYYNKNYVE